MQQTRILAPRLLALAASIACACGGAHAQSNLDKLKQMKVSGTDLNLPTVPQSGKNADDIRANLKHVKLPPGFSISLYAVVPDARDMAVAPSTNMLFVSTRKTTVWAVTNRNGGDMATEVKPFAPSLKFHNPNGVCWTRDGVLVVVEHNRVLSFPAAEFFYEGPDVAVNEVVPQGELIPPEEESYNHGARVCRVGPDGKLYITVGQPFNVPPAAKVALYRKLGMGGILRMNLDGSQREVYAVGVRNSVGEDFNPKDGTLWFTDNQTDGMGDGIPPGELNHATKMGQDFGYPYWNGHVRVAGTAAAPDLKNLPEPVNAVFPQVEFPAHQAQLGMTFYTGKMFPEKYRGGIFVASHGSWNSTVPTGALINFVPLVNNDKAGKSEVFADGFRDENGIFRGRPVDVAMMKDGSLLISDDFAGAIYRVTYSAP
ncbi:MAG: PQQ-dependent sugar dehydrogenase [Burkholderiales bacterium]|nr:PQQ-dependent sugar dehydrogenase [Burkholderiales bacterium]MDE1929549.1 PQQ-dependent sugar dehydrogenase [Burkholderiales bacterium]MDE2157872.1 PQQ-dependent sugar dehydrogenase [Burkholderiales bacterium]MDE2503188.1 PQQ-dependent sugar dehydrogenase [Burkholderiales bacterium]